MFLKCFINWCHYCKQKGAALTVTPFTTGIQDTFSPQKFVLLCVRKPMFMGLPQVIIIFLL